MGKIKSFTGGAKPVTVVMPVVSPSDLKHCSIELLGAAGATANEAEIVGTHLVESNFAGHDSDVLRIPQYAEEIRRCAVRPGTELAITEETESSVLIDGFQTFGQLAWAEARRHAIEKARAVGIGMASLRCCNHSGRFGAYIEVSVG